MLRLLGTLRGFCPLSSPCIDQGSTPWQHAEISDREAGSLHVQSSRSALARLARCLPTDT